MSKKETPRAPLALTEVKVEGKPRGRVKVEGKPRGGGKVTAKRDGDFVYVNSAFVGSVNSVNNVNTDNARTTSVVPAAPITGVYREQYWACSRWPYTQRVLAIAVGVLLGALIGLILSIVLGDDSDNSVLGPIFTRHAVPD